jgi:hypothetical protein
MEWQRLAKDMASAGSMVTVETMARRLDISERTAINYISEMRERGFVETERGRRGKRIYRISPIRRRKSGYPGLYETINRHSPIKLVEPYRHRIHDHELSIEEAVVRAVATKEFRVVLASLALFSRVEDWSSLYGFAKEYRVERNIGALYDLSRRCLRVRRMDGRIRRMLKSAGMESRYIIENAKTRDFKEIERKWGVFIPFNAADLERYKE